MTERTVVLSRLLRRIEVSDPGRVRLRNAGTAALSVSIAIAVMAGISVGLHRAMELVTVCGFMAMEAAVMVKDASIRERKITPVLLVVPAVAAASVAAV
ncbi:MAG: hypothetical protein L0H59_07540, partial [Tomitella sp.]|nr:hypothetical protein [Tomitella sp.]